MPQRDTVAGDATARSLTCIIACIQGRVGAYVLKLILYPGDIMSLHYPAGTHPTDHETMVLR